MAIFIKNVLYSKTELKVSIVYILSTSIQLQYTSYKASTFDSVLSQFTKTRIQFCLRIQKIQNDNTIELNTLC